MTNRCPKGKMRYGGRNFGICVDKNKLLRYRQLEKLSKTRKLNSNQTKEYISLDFYYIMQWDDIIAGKKGESGNEVGEYDPNWG